MLKTAEGLAGPYVWGQYDILVLPPSFPYGGMENPCLTFATPTLLVNIHTCTYTLRRINPSKSWNVLVKSSRHLTCGVASCDLWSAVYCVSVSLQAGDKSLSNVSKTWRCSQVQLHVNPSPFFLCSWYVVHPVRSSPMRSLTAGRVIWWPTRPGNTSGKHTHSSTV